MALDYEALPLLKSFDGLKRGHKVYSRKHGVGSVFSVYQNDQIIVQFSNMRMRFSASDEEIAKIPDEHLKKPKMRTEVYLGSEKVSFKEFKKRKQLEEIRKANQKIVDEIHRVNEKRAKKSFPETLFE